jgi:hypothetical protein
MVGVAPRDSIQGSGDRGPRTTLDRPRGLCVPETHGFSLRSPWREKRGETEPEDLSGNHIVQLGVATETLNRLWYERNSQCSVTDVQRWVQHPVHRYLAATLDGFVNALDAVFEAKFMLPWSFSEEAAAERHMAQLQHNMWVTNARSAALSIITGGGKWIEMTLPADALYPLRPTPSAEPQGQRRITVPVCRFHHRELHRYGDEASW